MISIWLLELGAIDELEELFGFCALDELAGTFEELEIALDDFGELDDDSAAVQFSPKQNVSVSPGVPMLVIFNPVLDPLYQRIAGYLSSENSEYVPLLKNVFAVLPGFGHWSVTLSVDLPAALACTILKPSLSEAELPSIEKS